MDRPQVWIVSPAWRRYSVTRLVLAQRADLAAELAARGLDIHNAIVADDENLDIAREYGAVALKAPNRPLGAKCNVGLRYAGEQGADWVVWIGSDDWVHADVFDPILAADTAPHRTRPILNGHRLAAVDLITGRLRRLRSPSRFGAIPWIVPRALLKPCGWEPVKPDSNRGLDGALIRGMRGYRVKPEFHFYNPHDLRCVDFKTDTNLNGYSKLGKALGMAPEEDAWPALTEHYPSHLVEMARSTHLELQGVV